MSWVKDPLGNQVNLTSTGLIPLGANTAFGTDAHSYVANLAGQTVPDSIWGNLEISPNTQNPTSQTYTLKGEQPMATTTPTNISQTSPYVTSEANNVNPLLTTPSAGTTTYATTGYTNPSAVNAGNPQFGTSSQFNIPPFTTPFPYEQQKAENQALVSGYEQAIAGQETLPAMRSRYENYYNIPQLREAFQSGRESLADVTAAMEAMPETIRGTTRESLMTEGQRQNLLTSKLQPLREVAAKMGETVTRVGAMLTENEQNLNTAMQYDIAQQKKELSPWEWRYDLNNIMQSREYTGWTFANSQELTRLISNQNAGLTWTNAEASRAHELALQEARYNLELRNYEKMSEMALDLW